MKKILILSLVMIAACAPHARNIQPSYVDQSRYDSMNCQKLATEKDSVAESLNWQSSNQDHAAKKDSWMVALVGFPVSGGGVKGEVARLKGEQIAIDNAMKTHGCVK